MIAISSMSAPVKAKPLELVLAAVAVPSLAAGVVVMPVVCVWQPV
jgi:hypothetical protein